MAPLKQMMRVLAVSSLAAFTISLAASPVSAALAPREELGARHIHAHGSMARRMRRTVSARRTRFNKRDDGDDGDDDDDDNDGDDNDWDDNNGGEEKKSASSASGNTATSTPEARKKRRSRCAARGAVSTPPATPTPTPPATPTPPPAPSPPPAPGQPASSKCGLLWPNQEDPAIQYYATPQCKTMYTWTTACPQTANTYGIECPPMFWGANMQDQITDAVHNSNASHVMGFNEPDLSSQSNLSPQDAAQLWKDYMLGFKSLGKQLVSPATTAGGLQWFDDFLTALGGLPASQIDVIAVHWYGTDFTDFQNYVNSWKKYGKNIWVTEMACQDFSGQGKWCSMDDIQSLMSQAMAWMESDPQIEKYFWFAPMRDMTNVNPLNCLMTIGGPNDGQPTSLGWYYVSN